MVMIRIRNAQKCEHLPPLNHTFLKRRFPTDFKKYTHTAPKGTKFWHIRRKVQKTWENCQNPPSWHILNEAERFGRLQYDCSAPIMVFNGGILNTVWGVVRRMQVW